jgi:hypothetical protein
MTPGYATTLDHIVMPFRRDNAAGHVAPMTMVLYRPDQLDYDNDDIVDEYFPLVDLTGTLTQRSTCPAGRPTTRQPLQQTTRPKHTHCP